MASQSLWVKAQKILASPEKLSFATLKSTTKTLGHVSKSKADASDFLKGFDFSSVTLAQKNQVVQTLGLRKTVVEKAPPAPVPVVMAKKESFWTKLFPKRSDVVVAAVLLALAVLVIILASQPSRSLAQTPVTPAAPEVSTPAASDAIVETEVSVAPLAGEQPKTAEAQTSPSLPVIMTVTQVGGGEFIKGWEVMPQGWPQVTTGTVTMPTEDKRDWDGIMKEDGKPIYVVVISSDPGGVSFEGKGYPFPDKGFVAAFITSAPDSITLTTGWNEPNEHYNVWMEKFVVPADEVLDDVLKDKLAWKQATEKKPIAFAILSTGELFKLK